MGFTSLLIDEALRMAYGVSSTTFLLSFSITPAITSASIYTAEIFTNGVFRISHLRLGIVNK